MKQWLFGIAGLLGISTDLGSLLRGFRGFSLFQYMPHFNPTGRSTKTKRTIHIRAPKDHVLDSLWLTGYTRIPSFLECEGCRLSFGCSHVLCVHFDELVVHLSSSVQACDLCHRLSGLSWPEQRNYRGVYIYIYIYIYWVCPNSPVEPSVNKQITILEKGLYYLTIIHCYW